MWAADARNSKCISSDDERDLLTLCRVLSSAETSDAADTDAAATSRKQAPPHD